MVLDTSIINLNDVAEVEELSEPEFTDHVDIADISPSRHFSISQISCSTMDIGTKQFNRNISIQNINFKF